MTQESRACSSVWKEFGSVGHCNVHRHFQGNSKQSPFPFAFPQILSVYIKPWVHIVVVIEGNWLNSTLVYGTFCGHLRKTS
uniref:Chromosome 12 C12orf75 homolog n=1 Tax=Pan troglodytes TaxID=9598 RepID=K7AN72_PANTR